MAIAGNVFPWKTVKHFFTPITHLHVEAEGPKSIPWHNWRSDTGINQKQSGSEHYPKAINLAKYCQMDWNGN
jgi:hypothetical protein